MLLFKLILFVGIFLGLTYGIEFLMPPFGQLYYVDPLEILLSLSQTLTYKIGVSKNLAMGLTVLLIGIIPLICVILLSKATKKRNKQNINLNKILKTINYLRASKEKQNGMEKS